MVHLRFDDDKYHLIATSSIMKNVLAMYFSQYARRIHINVQLRKYKLLDQQIRIPQIPSS